MCWSIPSINTLSPLSPPSPWEFDCHLCLEGGVGNLNLALVGWGIQTSRKHVSILNIEEFKDKESAFVRKWLRSKFLNRRMMLMSRKSQTTTPKTNMWLCNFLQHLLIIKRLLGIQLCLGFKMYTRKAPKEHLGAFKMFSLIRTTSDQSHYFQTRPLFLIQSP